VIPGEKKPCHAMKMTVVISCIKEKVEAVFIVAAFSV